MEGKGDLYCTIVGRGRGILRSGLATTKRWLSLRCVWWKYTKLGTQDDTPGITYSHAYDYSSHVTQMINKETTWSCGEHSSRHDEEMGSIMFAPAIVNLVTSPSHRRMGMASRHHECWSLHQDSQQQSGEAGATTNFRRDLVYICAHGEWIGIAAVHKRGVLPNFIRCCRCFDLHENQKGVKKSSFFVYDSVMKRVWLSFVLESPKLWWHKRALVSLVRREVVWT